MEIHKFFISYPYLKKYTYYHVYQLDADERGYQTAETVDEQVPTQQSRSTDGLVGHTAKCQRNEQRNEDGIEVDSRQYCAFGLCR